MVHVEFGRVEDDFLVYHENQSKEISTNHISMYRDVVTNRIIIKENKTINFVILWKKILHSWTKNRALIF